MQTFLIVAVSLGVALFLVWAVVKLFEHRAAKRRFEGTSRSGKGQRPPESDSVCVYIKPMPDDGDYIQHVRVAKRTQETSKPLPKLPYEAVTEPEQPPLKPGQNRTRFVDDWGTHLKNMKVWN